MKTKKEISFEKKNNTPRANHSYDRLLGFRDISAAEYHNWQIIMDMVRKMARIYSFDQIEVPVLENYELYNKLLAKGSSSLMKEVYQIIGANGEKIALRPNLFFGMMRSVFEQNIEEEGPIRLFSLGPVFRQSKLQSGNYRQATNFNLLILNEKKAMAESMLILLAYNFFRGLGIDVQIQINSIGDKVAQKEYLHRLVDYYKERGKRSKLCAECKKHLAKNPLALLDCQEKECLDIRQDAPQITNYLSDESRDYFTKVLEYLDELGVNYNFDPYLIKDFNVYNDTVFEVWPISSEGRNQAKYFLGAGGRCNQAWSHISGIESYAVDFTFDLERVLNKLKEKRMEAEKDKDIVFVAQLSDQAKIRSMAIFQELLEAGYQVRQSFTVDSLKAQLEKAKKMEARITLIMGKKEYMDDTILFRDMESGVQESVPQKKILNKVGKLINNK